MNRFSLSTHCHTNVWVTCFRLINRNLSPKTNLQPRIQTTTTKKNSKQALKWIESGVTFDLICCATVFFHSYIPFIQMNAHRYDWFYTIFIYLTQISESYRRTWFILYYGNFKYLFSTSVSCYFLFCFFFHDFTAYIQSINVIN